MLPLREQAADWDALRHHRIQECVKNKHFDSFALISDRGGRVKDEFVKGGKTLPMYPWNDSSMTIRHIHGLTCKRFDYDTDAKIKAVISVRAYFTRFQCAGDDAGTEMAWFDVMRVINEPTAAAIAELSEASSPDQRMIASDFGGGTFEVTVMDITTDGGKRSFKVVSTHGDTFLGVVVFDRELMQMVLEHRGEVPI